MYTFEFYYLPGRFLGYSELSELVKKMKTIASYEGKHIESPAREYLKNKIIVVANKAGKPVSYRMAEFVKIPYFGKILALYNSVSVPSISKNDIDYEVHSKIVSNLLFRFYTFQSIYVCCINSNFYDIYRFENEYMDVFPTIITGAENRGLYSRILDYLVENRQEIIGITDSSEVNRTTYFINNGRLIQIGRINIIKHISNIYRNKDYNQRKQVFTPRKNAI